MSAASSLTARIMETWAHTQDIADALGVTREPTSRLRHVAHIGVGARAFSYAVHGQALPGLERYARLEVCDGGPRLVASVEASRGCKHLCRHCPIVPVFKGKFIAHQWLTIGDVTCS